MLHYRRMALALGLLLGAGALACAVNLGIGEASKPVVEILSPPSGSRVQLGEEVAVQFRGVDEVGLSRVELKADGMVVAVERSSRAEGEPSMTATLSWAPTTPGSHTLLLYAYNTEGAVSDPVGVSVIVAGPLATLTVPPPMPTETQAMPTPTDTLVPPTPMPATPTSTLAPPAPVPPTATHTTAPPTPVPPTPTRTPIMCPGIAINVPSHAYANRVFTLEWDSYPHAIPSGWEWGIRFKGAEADWTYLPVPLDPPAREEGGHWKADYLRGRGVEETLYWQACLVSWSDAAKAFQCCGPVPPWPIIHAR
jgi:hypothetical protein